MSRFKQQEALLWANTGTEIANILQQYMGQGAANRLKQQETMDMALVQILSSGLSDVRKEINTLDTWLQDKGLYGMLKEEDKTAEMSDWINMLKEGKVEDYEDLGEVLKLKIDDINSSIDNRRKIKLDYENAVKQRQAWADQYGAIGGDSDPEGAFQLSGEPIYNPVYDMATMDYGELLKGNITPVDQKFAGFTPGSELAALFDPTSIYNEIVAIDSIIKGGPGALQESKYNSKFKSIAELKQYKKEQQNMLDNMAELGIDMQSGLDEKMLSNQAYLKGFLEGKVDNVTAQKQAAAELQLKNAQQVSYQQNYEQAEIGYQRASAASASLLTPRLILPGPAGVNYNLMQYMDLARTNPDDAISIQQGVMDNIATKYPLALPYAQAMLNEQLNPQDVNKTQSVKLASDMYEKYITMNTAWQKISQEIGEEDQSEIMKYIRANRSNPLVKDYVDASTMLKQLQAIGFDINTVGLEAARTAFEITKGSEANLDKYTENIIRMGNNSVLQSDVLKASLEEEFDVYSAFNNFTPIQDANNNEMGSFLTGEATGEYIDRSNKLRDMLGSTQVDQAADAIAEMFGVPTWENYNNVNDFKQEIINKIDSQYGQSPKLRKQALERFETMWLNLVRQRRNPETRAPFDNMSMQGLTERGRMMDELYRTSGMTSGYMPGGYVPPQMTFSNPIEGLYNQLASVKESLNSLSVLGIGDEIMQMEDIFDEERNK
tara:strand:- start:3478 stop:5634 length:2157 start_codon:yes stop_codon:yes gene_type:complete